jgi:hypothetical protein
MINRHKLSFVIVFGIAASILFAIFSSQIQAVAWHCIHGNHLKAGNTRLTLPLLWWPRNKDENGTIEIARAKMAHTGLFESVYISPLKPDQIRSREELRDNWNKILDRYSSGYPKTIKPTELRTRDLTLYCMKDIRADAPIVCWSPDAPWKIGYIGLGEHAKEADSIIASMEKSP